MLLPDQVDLSELAYLMHQAAEELERQSRIVKSRELEAGYFDTDLADELQDKALLGGQAADIEGINLVSVALNTLLRRVSLQSVKTADEAQTVWLQQVARANKILQTQRSLHRAAIRDVEAFLIVEYDQYAPRPWAAGERGLPRFYVHERFTSAAASYGGTVGSNEGCIPHYRNNDPDQGVEMVAKRWVQSTYENEEIVTRQRMTLFIAEQFETKARIEKFIMDDNGEWAQHKDQYRDAAGNIIDEEWPIWWTADQTENGESLPLPVFVFQNGEGQPAFKRAWGLQSGLDQVYAALMAATTMTGHQLLVALGFYPTTDGKAPNDDGTNLMSSRPREIIGTTVKRGEADMFAIPPADLRPIIDTLETMSKYFALVVGLPLKNFTFTRQVSSGEALRHGEVELVATANELTDLFEPEWIGAFELARKLDNLYGGGSWDETAEITLQWAPKETVSQEVKADEVAAKLAAGVPQEQVQADVFGYSEEEIAQNAAANGAGAPTGGAGAGAPNGAAVPAGEVVA